MGLLSTLLAKVFGGAPAATATVLPQTAGTTAPAAGAPTSTPAPVVDVSTTLDSLAAANSEKLDWKKSIVDLMKLVGMDSSLANRKELAKELNYPGDTSDSAAMNIWLHKEVLKKISENGGKVPASLLD